MREAPLHHKAVQYCGEKGGEGPLGNHFDVVGEDDKFGQNTWEEAEDTLQEAFTLAVGRAGLKTGTSVICFRGSARAEHCDILRLMDYQVPLFGLYGACSTCGEALSLGAMCVAAGVADYVVAMTSSHFASAEKQFRFPLEYANQRRNRRRGRSQEVAPMCSGKKKKQGAHRWDLPARSSITASRIR